MCRKLAISWTTIALALGVPQAMAGDASATIATQADGYALVAGGTLPAFPHDEGTPALARPAALQQ